MAYFEHEFNDYVTVRGETIFSRLDYSTRTFAPSIDEWPTGVRRYDHTQPVAIGSLPGNPYRAYADDSNVCDVPEVAAGIPACGGYLPAHERDLRDAQDALDFGYVFTGNRILVSHGNLDWEDVDGDGRYDYLQEPGEWLLFAQDRNGDGIPDRDFNGDGIADDAELADASGQTNPLHRVVLLSMTEDRDGDGVPDRFDPDMDGRDSNGDGVLDTFTSGGVRLFEDVLMGDTGIGIHGYIGAFPKQPYVHESYPWLNEDMSLNDRRLSENLRLRLGTTVNIPDTDWLIDADWIWNKSRREWVSLDPAWPLTVDSLRCQGGPNGNSCWNPFSTAWLSQDPATGLVLPADQQAWRSKDDPAWNTSTETRNAGLSPRHVQRDVGMTLLDLNASNGRLFDLWYNETPVGVAVGIHMRTEDEDFRPDQLGAAGISSDRVDFQGTSEEVRAGFVEVRVQPISSERFGQMEVQAARPLHGVRYQRLLRLHWPIGWIRSHDPQTGDSLPAKRLARDPWQHHRRLRATGELPVVRLGARQRRLRNPGRLPLRRDARTGVVREQRRPGRHSRGRRSAKLVQPRLGRRGLRPVERRVLAESDGRRPGVRRRLHECRVQRSRGANGCRGHLGPERRAVRICGRRANAPAR